MRAVLTWQVNAPEREGVTGPVYDICFNPAGSHLVIACGNLVLVYDASDGVLLHRLKGHKDTVYCLSYSKDGKRFSSGGADKCVIIWKNTCEGILKYSHNDSIQSLCYNPVTHQLASVSCTDFGFWSPDQKSVSKFKIASKGLCCSWTSDGQFLAIGHFDGMVSIRAKDGSEKLRLPSKDSPIWSVCFNPSGDEDADVLAVACWNGTVCVHSMDIAGGKQAPPKEKKVEWDPCSVRFFSNGEYMVVGGSNNKAVLWTKDGVQLAPICQRDDWIWSVAPRPRQNYVAVGCNDGSVALYQLVFSTVHGLYQDRYVYRDCMTDVIIQHLVTEQKARIKCKDHVKKIAVYRGRLAVQLPDKVLVYELPGEEEEDNMQYRKRETIAKAMDCNLLVVTSQHVILCLERKLQLFSFRGDKEREWVLDSVIRYIKVVGGPSRREGLLAGLKSGEVVKIFIDNPFPIPVVQHTSAIRCLDLSCTRRRLAIVDELSTVVVYDVQTREKLYEDKNANSVAWNSVLEDQLCYSGKDQLCIKTGDFPVHREKLQGFVVGVRGSKIFCLHYLAMNTVNVPQSAAVYRYIEKKLYPDAYKVACMGVTDSDWHLLAVESLMAGELEVSERAFIRVRDIKYIDLIHRIRAARKVPGSNDSIFLAEAVAYQGNFVEAGRILTKAARPDLAIKMYSDLKRWEDARAIAAQSQAMEGMDVRELIRSQAQWALDNRDWKAAASILVASEEYGRAVDIMVSHGLTDELIDVVRKLDKADVVNLARCAAALHERGQTAHAKEAYIKMGNSQMLLKLYIDSEKWEDAFLLLKQHPDMGDQVHLPYARFLTASDRFEEAQEAYRKAGRPDEAIRTLDKLCASAIVLARFADAAYFYWLLAVQHARLFESDSDEAHVKRYLGYSDRADVYFAYQSIHQYTTQPFTSHVPEAIFHTARFIIGKLDQLKEEEALAGVSRVCTLWALGEQARKLGCFKVARKAYDQLSAMRLPDTWQDKVDLATIQVRGKAMVDKDEILSGEVMFSGVRSFINMDLLPLVEFRIPEGMSREEALRLIGSESEPAARRGGGAERAVAGGNVLSMEDDEGQDSMGSDLAEFQQQLLSSADDSLPICPPEVLRRMSRGDVLVQRSQCRAVSDRYFRLMAPDVGIVVCAACGRMFAEEDFETEYLKAARCPFCRTTDSEDILWPSPSFAD